MRRDSESWLTMSYRTSTLSPNERTFSAKAFYGLPERCFFSDHLSPARVPGLVIATATHTKDVIDRSLSLRQMGLSHCYHERRRGWYMLISSSGNDGPWCLPTARHKSSAISTILVFNRSLQPFLSRIFPSSGYLFLHLIHIC